MLRVGRDSLTFNYFNEGMNDIFSKMVILWNELPFSIRSSESEVVFKTRLKTLFFEQSFL